MKQRQYFSIPDFLVKIVLGFSIFLSAHLCAQDSGFVMSYDLKKVTSCTKHRNDPVKLVTELTKGLSSDKEKFDAIFAWVALTIKYDHEKAYSESGSPLPNLREILKEKKGICIDYAYLMDTLCSIANVESYTVNGYSKDLLFDLGDSFYADNHAWNAVKLDDKWFVYDVTWAASHIEVRLNRLGRKVARWLENWPMKKKKKAIKNKYIKECEKYCPPESYSMIPREYVFTWEKVRFPLLKRFLSKRTFRFTRRYVHVLDSGLYLCQPEVFAITHYPDHPIWTLLKDKSIHDFSIDSLYYYHSKRDYKEQVRYGVDCEKCDSIVNYTTKVCNQDLLKHSMKSNPNNRFITFETEFSLGNMEFIEALRAKDSVDVMRNLDTTLTYLYGAKRSLQAARRFSDTESRALRRKNKKKSIIQFSDNKRHRIFFNGLALNANKQNVNIKEEKRAMRISRNKLKYRRKFLKQMKTAHTEKGITINEAAKKEILKKIEKLRIEKDTINSSINLVKAWLGDRFPTVVDSIKLKLQNHLLFLSPFEQKASLRGGLLDDYKKEIIDIKKHIERSKAGYKRDLDSTILLQIAVMTKQLTKLTSAIEKRNAINKQIHGEYIKLAKAQEMAESDVEAIKQEFISENNDDFCWVFAHSYFMELESFGFKLLANKLKSPDVLFYYERQLEKERVRYINKEIDHRRRRHRYIVWSNNKLNNDCLKGARDYRKSYLKQLSKERRKKRKAK